MHSNYFPFMPFELFTPYRWSDASISRFKDLALNKVMHAYPKLPFPSILLTDIRSKPHIDIHALLTSEGFAAAST